MEKSLIYFDNAATSQTPISVIESILIIIKSIMLISTEEFIQLVRRLLKFTKVQEKNSKTL